MSGMLSVFTIAIGRLIAVIGFLVTNHRRLSSASFFDFLRLHMLSGSPTETGCCSFYDCSISHWLIIRAEQPRPPPIVVENAGRLSKKPLSAMRGAI